jgi:putative endonuclease
MPTRGDKGREAEDLALRFLKKRGFKLLARNWRDRRGELDLVGREGDTLCVVEVRSRTSTSPYTPEMSLSPIKITRLHRTSQRLLQKLRLAHVPLRLDLLVVDWDTREIKYYPGAIPPPSNRP